MYCSDTASFVYDSFNSCPRSVLGHNSKLFQSWKPELVKSDLEEGKVLLNNFTQLS